jgi:hypothetical protein
MCILFFNDRLNAAGNNTSKIEDFSSRCGDISCTAAFPPPDKQGVKDKRFVLT